MSETPKPEPKPVRIWTSDDDEEDDGVVIYNNTLETWKQKWPHLTPNIDDLVELLAEERHPYRDPRTDIQDIYVRFDDGSAKQYSVRTEWAPSFFVERETTWPPTPT